MDFLISPLTAVAAFVLVFGVLVFVHEMGHFWVARRAGVLVERFSIGFGPEIFGWTDKHGTRWKISWIPLGGYVKFFGDETVFSTSDDEIDQLSDEEKEKSFHHKSLRQRTAIVAAGPLANLLFAIVVFAIFFSIYGQPYTAPVIDRVLPDSAAEEVGLEAGDRIVQIGGEQIFRFEDIGRIVSYHAGDVLPLTIIRGEQVRRLTITPQATTRVDAFGDKREVGQIGIESRTREIIDRNPLEAVWYGFLETGRLIRIMMDFVGKIIAGDRPSEELGGPLAIAQLSGQSAQAGIVDLIFFMALLSVNLGLINLFPIPLLDGGHLLFYCFEAVRGKPLSIKAQEYGFRLGLAAVLTLTIFVTWNDLNRLDVFDYLAKLFA